MQEVQGRREQRGKEQEALVNLLTDFSKATRKRIQQAPEERGVSCNHSMFGQAIVPWLRCYILSSS